MDTEETPEWTYASIPFNSGSNTRVRMQCRLGNYGGICTGTAWFDDLVLEEIQ